MGKRLLDIVVAASALAAAVPLLVVAVIGISLTSPGPIFYRSRRMARDRRHAPYQTDAAAQSPERRRRDG
jgi:lipopolysaccharide/colanic/teichoic acid biosynthesis glycosyltransferase